MLLIIVGRSLDGPVVYAGSQFVVQDSWAIAPYSPDDCTSFTDEEHASRVAAALTLKQERKDMDLKIGHIKVRRISE